MKIYIVNGAPGSGKTTFEFIVQKLLGKDRCGIESTIDAIKTCARITGWDGAKTPESRKFLSELKQFLKERTDYPYKVMKNKIMDHTIKNTEVLFIDSREPEEIERFKNDYNAKTIIVRRDSAEDREASNSSDANILNYKYDYSISNNRDIYNLIEMAAIFLKWEKIDI